MFQVRHCFVVDVPGETVLVQMFQVRVGADVPGESVLVQMFQVRQCVGVAVPGETVCWCRCSR